MFRISSLARGELVSAVLLLTAAPVASQGTAGHPMGAEVRFEDALDDVSAWTGCTLETTTVREGSAAAGWHDTLGQTTIRRDFAAPLEWGASALGFWMHSAVANEAELQIVLASENPATAGPDYFTRELIVDWSGWRWVWLRRDDFHAERTPLGWNHVESIAFHSAGWGHTPFADTDLVLDHLIVTQPYVTGVRRQDAWIASDYFYRFLIDLEEPHGLPTRIHIREQTPAGIEALAFEREVALTPYERRTVSVDVPIPMSAQSAGPYAPRSMKFRIETPRGARDLWSESIPNPALVSPAPRALMNATDIARIQTLVANYGWAQTRRNEILQRGNDWLNDYLQSYGFGAFTLPPEGGQWSQHYVCPAHGVPLAHTPPLIHTCPVDGQVLSGWPYDQVIYGRAHDDLSRAAKDTALSYALTLDASFAASTRQILLAYAATYDGYDLHDPNAGTSLSGARIHAQTLNEAEWLVHMAWAYDLVSSSSLFTLSERRDVKTFLRNSANTILRNTGNAPNWQSWHSAAAGVAGRAIEDPVLVSAALHRRGGFYHQMETEVTADGFWSEGSWGYHFFALRALTYLAEAGERGGFPLYPHADLERIYRAPIEFALPDQTLPPFNDSPEEELNESSWLFEAGYRAYGDPNMTAPLHAAARDERAMFFGAETLPPNVTLPHQSQAFPDSGYAVLRGGTSLDPWYLALDFGPHGGWHGHYDKLGFVFYGRGRTLGLDPGRHSYASPLHDTWDRTTVAHNTLVVDETSQAPTEGALEQFIVMGSAGMIEASANEAYESADLRRTVVMVDDYVVDVFSVNSTDGQEHIYDWFYHNPGSLTSYVLTLPVGAPPTQPGYQHLTELEFFHSENNTHFDFDFVTPQDYPGLVWASQPVIDVAAVYSNDVAQAGAWSHLASYDFTQAAPGGYALFGTPLLTEYPEVPTRVSVWIYGNSSNNSARLRIHDGAEEVFHSAYFPLDFDGWRHISIDVDATWTHSGGNDDEVIDVPVKRLVLQLRNEAAGDDVGQVYLDDWRLDFPSQSSVQVEDPETLPARERLWVLGQPDTTYVTGNGIGPDLTTPVPFVLIRRTTLATDFEVLHEPLSGNFGIISVDREANDDGRLFRIRSQNFEDVLLLRSSQPKAQAGTWFAIGEWRTDARVAWVRRNLKGDVVQRRIEEGRRVFLNDVELEARVR